MRALGFGQIITNPSTQIYSPGKDTNHAESLLLGHNNFFFHDRRFESLSEYSTINTSHLSEETGKEENNA